MPINTIRVLELLAVARRKSNPTERAGYLEGACGNDAELREFVLALLVAEQQPHNAAAEATTAPHQGIPLWSGEDRRGALLAGRYKLVQKLGEGGMGEVWMAEQSEPVKRVVALKIIKAGMDSVHVLARFEAERQALALMDHPNIAKVLDGGITESGRPFFVMELVKGISFTKYCDQEKLTPRERLELFIPVCQAVQHAHQKGIIHRDLKPSNILIALYDGKPVPKVIDFGVAKATMQKLTERTLYTEVGQFVGTPAYMPPEQAELNNLDIDTRADIYSLGVVLYELLTGTPPFTNEQLRNAGFAEMLRIIREVEPSKPSTQLSSSQALPSVAALRRLEPKRLTKLVSGDLDWIVMKCLEKERSRRYETANGLAQEIQRYLSDEPVEAGAPNATYRLRKFVRRHRGPMIAAMTVSLVLVAGIVGTTLGLVAAKQQEAEAIKQAKIAKDNEAKATTALAEKEAALTARSTALGEKTEALNQADEDRKDLNYNRGLDRILLAQAAFDSNNIALALERLNQVPLEWRKWEWYYLKRQFTGAIYTLHGHSDAVTSVSFSPDGKRIVTGSGDRTAKVWDVRTGGLLFDVKGNVNYVASASFSPDGKRIITGSWDKTPKVFDANTGAPLFDLNGHWLSAKCASFSPDGTRIVTGSNDATVRVWDAQTGTILLNFKGHKDEVTCVSFSPNGTRIVTASHDGTVKLWDARSGKLLVEFRGHTHWVNSVSFSPDNARLVTGSWLTARVWDVITGTPLFDLNGHTGNVACVSFSPDGTRIVSASYDKTARVWDAKTGTTLFTLKGHTDIVNCASFSPDGMRIVTGSHDKTAKVWDAKTGVPQIDLNRHTNYVIGLSFSADGSWIVTGSRDQNAKVWNARSGALLCELKGNSDIVTSAAFNRDGTRIVTGKGTNAMVWNALSGTLLLDFKAHGENVTGVAFSWDGTRIATSGDDGARVWDAITGLPLLNLVGHRSHVTSVAFSRDGLRIVTGSGDNSAMVWDAITGALLLELKGHTGGVACVSISPDRKRIVTGSHDKTVKVWDAETGVPLFDLQGHSARVLGVSFSSDGSRILTASSDRTAKIWDAKTGTPLLDLKGHTNELSSATFSSDGSLVATGSFDKTARIWDFRGGNELKDRFAGEEWEYRILWTRPRPDLHWEEFAKAVQFKDAVAARFHLDRLLAYQPPERARLLAERIKLQSNDLLVSARTAVHSPALVQSNAAAILVLSTRWDPLSMRLLGGLLIRAGKSVEAIGPLKLAIALRANDRPPVEELLLALSCLEAKQPEEAAKWNSQAVAWLDRYQPPMQVLLGGLWSGSAQVLKSQLDPRYNAFDWETWYECEVFRAEVETKLK